MVVGLLTVCGGPVDGIFDINIPFDGSGRLDTPTDGGGCSDSRINGTSAVHTVCLGSICDAQFEGKVSATPSR